MSIIARSVMSAVLLASVTTMAADFLPLEPNNEWIYRNATTGSQFKVRVGAPVVLRDRIYHQLTGYTEQPVLVRYDERGLLFGWDEENERDVVLTSFQPATDALWKANFRPCDQHGQTFDRRTVFDGSAGPVRDALDIHYTIGSCADFGVERELFAENIGMLRRVVQTIAGPRDFDLAYARVGRVVIDAIPAGRFTVTADQHLGGDSISAMLRLQTNPASASLPLTFPTSQQFEIQLKDEQGRVVWTWSDGQSFVQAVRTLMVQGEWTAKVTIPKPTTFGQLRAEIYTIQAWLTTIGPAPQFAATVPVTITTGQQ